MDGERGKGPKQRGERADGVREEERENFRDTKMG